MAAPGDSGYGLGEQEKSTTVDLADVKRQAPEVVGVPDADGEVTLDEEQVAKKPRVQKAENGEKKEEVEAEEEATVEEVNGAKAEDEVENGAGEVDEPAAEDEEEATKEEAATDAAPGDGGLKALLQEGESDAKKSAVANHGADAAHMLNSAK